MKIYELKCYNYIFLQEKNLRKFLLKFFSFFLDYLSSIYILLFYYFTSWYKLIEWQTVSRDLTKFHLIDEKKFFNNIALKIYKNIL